VSIVCLYREGRRDLLEELRVADVRVIDKPDLNWHYNMQLQLGSLLRSSLMIRRLQPAIVHSLSVAGFGNEPLAVWLGGCPRYVVRKASERREGIARVWEWKYKPADRIVVLTQRMRALLLASLWAFSGTGLKAGNRLCHFSLHERCPGGALPAETKNPAPHSRSMFHCTQL